MVYLPIFVMLKSEIMTSAFFPFVEMEKFCRLWNFLNLGVYLKKNFSNHSLLRKLLQKEY